jgi:hypothetical protein
MPPMWSRKVPFWPIGLNVPSCIVDTKLFMPQPFP